MAGTGGKNRSTVRETCRSATLSSSNLTWTNLIPRCVGAYRSYAETYSLSSKGSL